MIVINKWPVVRLSTLAVDAKGAIAGGPFGSDLVSRDYVASGVPVIRGGNLSNYAKFSFDDLVFVTENKADTHRLNCAHPGDLVFTQRGTLGQVGLLPKNSPYSRFLISQSQMKMTVDANRADALYLYNYFRLPSTVSYIENHALQSGVPHINLGILKKLQVICPPLSVQKKIAAIISAYDELIENNRRRIVLLEKMAEEIYREWFVRMRFPGHEKVKKVKGVPEGWSFEKASIFFGLAKGKSYAAEELTDDTGYMPFINLKSFNRGGGYREDGLKYYSGRYKPEQVVRQNDVVMAVTDMTQDRAVVGRVARMPDLGEKGAVISLDTVKLVPKNIHKTYLYAYMSHSGFANFIKEFANGANVLHLKPELITKQKIIVPPKQLQNEFSPMVEPLYAEADLLGMTNRRLEKMRDAFLPRLISGKLPVENLDIQFPPCMAEDAHA